MDVPPGAPGAVGGDAEVPPVDPQGHLAQSPGPAPGGRAPDDAEAQPPHDLGDQLAVAVVAITLAAGLKAAGALTDNAQRLGDIVNAQWCADNALTNLRLAKQFPGVGDTEFSCNQMGRDYQGRLVTRPNRRSSDR